MRENNLSLFCFPSSEAAQGSYHWLDPMDGPLEVWRWNAGERHFEDGLSRIDPVQHSWGWRYAGPCSPPEIEP